MKAKENETTKEEKASEELPSENQASDSTETSIDDTQVKELSEKLNELNDKYLRLYSEFDNYRKRTARERIELSKTAGEDIFKSLLPVVDDFERALKVNETALDLKAVNEGIKLIHNKLNQTLSQQGIQPMESIGKDFDPDLHEAITNVPAPSDDMKGKVIDEVEKGYYLNGKVIRFAKVIVGK